MSDLTQLILVAEVETKREQKSAQNYQLAQKNADDNLLKLQGLEEYRLNYLKMMQEKGQAGFEAKNMHQHHSFVGKLDRACEQQTQFLNQAALAAEERKRQWIAQQRKRKAIEHLIDKKRVAQRSVETKREQQMFDEFALQKHTRKDSSYY